MDFDGVLHHENCYWHPRRGAYLVAPPEYKLFQHVGLLEELLAPYPHVGIVLATSWVRRYRYSETAKRLPPSLRARVIGATFHTSGLPRGQQAVEDVLRRKPARWLAMDDDAAGWPKGSLHNLVHTDEHAGISEPLVQLELIVKLTRFGGVD